MVGTTKNVTAASRAHPSISAGSPSVDTEDSVLSQSHTDLLPGRAICLLGLPGPGNVKDSPVWVCEPQGRKEQSWELDPDLKESTSLRQGTTESSSPKCQVSVTLGKSFPFLASQ